MRKKIIPDCKNQRHWPMRNEIIDKEVYFVCETCGEILMSPDDNKVPEESETLKTLRKLAKESNEVFKSKTIAPIFGALIFPDDTDDDNN